MKISLKWLKDYITVTAPAAEMAKRLTLAGCEPKEVLTTGGSWDNIVIGKIEAVNSHPNADRLHLVTVDVGAVEKPVVVCGAPNVAVGAKIAFGKVGAKVNDSHTGKIAEIKPAKIRGVESSGMCLSEKELGISENHEGILILPEDAPPGTALGEYLGDVIFDLEVTPNRPDCLSVIGIAREFAALYGQTVQIKEPVYPETGPAIDEKVSVEIQAPDLCTRYAASLVTGIQFGPSPQWLQERLIACGQRPINNVVDVSNYVMLEYGQPLHTFDYTALTGKKIIVRRAAPGEKILTLDNVERELTGDMLVIADEKRAVAVAGVIGGANSEVIEQTSMVLVEAASFKATSIHYTARNLHLSSEASQRFERGIRAELAMGALKRATQLLVELCGGQAAGGIIDIYPGKQEPAKITLPVAMAGRLLGVDFNFEQTVNTLTSLGFTCTSNDTHTEITAAVPYWRSDIKQPVDLVEEVARIAGYDKIPMTLLGEPIPPSNPDPIVGLKQKVRQYMVGFGFQEIVTYTLTGGDVLSKLYPEPHPYLPAPVHLSNPMTLDQEFLRPTLRANLLTAMAANRRFEENGIRLFEVSRVYIGREKGQPDERETFCGIMGGLRADKSCQTGIETIDFYDAKGVIESLLEKLGVSVVFEKSIDESLHLAKQAAIKVGNSVVGIFGELHPRVTRNFEINEAVYLLEMDLQDLVKVLQTETAYVPLPKFPAVVRDIALVVDINVTHRQILDAMRNFSLVSRVEIFDIYTGEQLPPGKKSMAYRLTFQSLSHTLKEEEVNGVLKGILNKLKGEVGAGLRT
jgi:phenylalanyl-tRNA synthetase beta chain